VGHSVEARVLDQNVEAVQKRSSGRAAAGIGCDGVSDNSLLADNRVFPLRLSGRVT
jgi:hypothetical protein